MGHLAHGQFGQVVADRPPPPSSPFPLVPHGGAKERGAPLPPILEKNPINHTTPPTTSPPLSYPWSQEGPRTRGIYSPQHAVTLRKFRQKMYFRNLGGIGGTGSRRHTPYVCDYSELPLRHRPSRQDRHYLEVGFGSTTSATFISER